jgi:hypothetical protein
MHVIARAYADKPLDRIVVERSPKLAYIASSAALSADDSDRTGVGFPVNNVYKFDESLFRLLVSAWESGDHKQLLDLWSRAEPI